MGKFSEIYKLLKNEDSETLYLFKMGIFYNFMNDDAKLINQKIPLKITSFGDDIKCGFPRSSLKDHLENLKEKQFNYLIIDDGKKIKKEDENNYVQEISKQSINPNNNEKYIEIGKEIEKLNLASITAVEALNLITKYQSILLK